MDMRWDAITKRLKKINKEKIIGVEVGTWEGENASHLLRMNENLSLICIDQWLANDPSYIITKDSKSVLSQDLFDAAYHKTLRTLSDFTHNKCLIIKSSSEKAIKNFQNESLDFAFIDANHSFLNAFQDIRLWWDKIIPGGFICGHDFKVYAGIQQAVESFVTHIIKKDLSVIELDSDFTWFIYK